MSCREVRRGTHIGTYTWTPREREADRDKYSRGWFALSVCLSVDLADLPVHVRRSCDGEQTARRDSTGTFRPGCRAKSYDFDYENQIRTIGVIVDILYSDMALPSPSGRGQRQAAFRELRVTNLL